PGAAVAAEVTPAGEVGEGLHAVGVGVVRRGDPRRVLAGRRSGREGQRRQGGQQRGAAVPVVVRAVHSCPPSGGGGRPTERIPRPGSVRLWSAARIAALVLFFFSEQKQE